MPISCHMRDLGFSDSEAPAAKCPTPKPTHIGHFSSSAAHRKVRGLGGGGAADGAERKGRGDGGAADGAKRKRRGAGGAADGAKRKGRGAKWKGWGVPGQQRARSSPEPLLGWGGDGPSGRGGTSCASEEDEADGAGRRPCAPNDARGGLASRRAFEKVARLTSSWRNWRAPAF